MAVNVSQPPRPAIDVDRHARGRHVEEDADTSSTPPSTSANRCRDMTVAAMLNRPTTTKRAGSGSGRAAHSVRPRFHRARAESGRAGSPATGKKAAVRADGPAELKESEQQRGKARKQTDQCRQRQGVAVERPRDQAPARIETARRTSAGSASRSRRCGRDQGFRRRDRRRRESIAGRHQALGDDQSDQRRSEIGHCPARKCDADHGDRFLPGCGVAPAQRVTSAPNCPAGASGCLQQLCRSRHARRRGLSRDRSRRTASDVPPRVGSRAAWDRGR